MPFPGGIIVEAWVVKTLLAAWPLPAAWLLSKQKAHRRLPAGNWEEERLWFYSVCHNVNWTWYLVENFLLC